MEGQKRELVKTKLHCWELRKWFLWITYVGEILKHLVLWTVHIPQLRNTWPKTQSMIQTWHSVSKYGMTGFHHNLFSLLFLYAVAAAAKSLQLCPTLCDPMDYSPPGSSVHGILQARLLEWVAMPSSRRSSQPRDWTQGSQVSCIDRWVLYL